MSSITKVRNSYLEKIYDFMEKSKSINIEQLGAIESSLDIDVESLDNLKLNILKNNFFYFLAEVPELPMTVVSLMETLRIYKAKTNCIEYAPPKTGKTNAIAIIALYEIFNERVMYVDSDIYEDILLNKIRNVFNGMPQYIKDYINPNLLESKIRKYIIDVNNKTVFMDTIKDNSIYIVDRLDTVSEEELMRVINKVNPAIEAKCRILITVTKLKDLNFNTVQRIGKDNGFIVDDYGIENLGVDDEWIEDLFKSYGSNIKEFIFAIL